jgi:hypothetical protein
MSYMPRHTPGFPIQSPNVFSMGDQPRNNSEGIDFIMSLDVLDRLKRENEDRIKSIEERYFKKKEETRQVREILHEKADVREMKEKHVDSSLSYPTYGRGVDPDPNINTYMMNKNLCHDGESPTKKRKGTDEEDNRLDKGKRPKIISPRRQKFETQFERFMVHKYVEEELKEKP